MAKKVFIAVIKLMMLVSASVSLPREALAGARNRELEQDSVLTSTMEQNQELANNTYPPFFEGFIQARKGSPAVATISKKTFAGGVYTIVVIDSCRRKSTLSFTLDIKKPKKPKISKISVRSTKITGTAEVDICVYIKVGRADYKRVNVNSKGRYLLKIKKQKRNTVIRAYAQDRAGNRSRVKKVVVEK